MKAFLLEIESDKDQAVIGSLVYISFHISHQGVSKNNGTPKSSILIGFSIIIINHPFWGTPIFMIYFMI